MICIFYRIYQSLVWNGLRSFCCCSPLKITLRSTKLNHVYSYCQNHSFTLKSTQCFQNPYLDQIRKVLNWSLVTVGDSDAYEVRTQQTIYQVLLFCGRSQTVFTCTANECKSVSILCWQKTKLLVYILYSLVGSRQYFKRLSVIQ